MPKRHVLLSAVFGVLLATTGSGFAQQVLLSDTFDLENGGLGAAEYSRFANWTAANVDLLAPGYFFNLCQAAGGSTPCIDMEGSGNGSLTTRATYDVLPGTVTMNFDLAGDRRRGPSSDNGVTVSLVSIFGNVLFNENIRLPSDASFQTFSRVVTIASPSTVRLGFLSTGAADSFGMLLDNVVMTAGGAVTAPVPEPRSWALMAGGLAALAAAVRRRQQGPDEHARLESTPRPHCDG